MKNFQNWGTIASVCIVISIIGVTVFSGVLALAKWIAIGLHWLGVSENAATAGGFAFSILGFGWLFFRQLKTKSVVRPRQTRPLSPQEEAKTQARIVAWFEKNDPPRL